MSDKFRVNLQRICEVDVQTLIVKDKEYGSSWSKRGGVGAFMMAARKFDRIEQQVKAHGFDIFAAIDTDKRPEGIIDDIQDLRRYLLLIEEYVISPSNKESPRPRVMPHGFDPVQDCVDNKE